MRSFSPAIERCRPLLGTLVSMRVQGLAAADQTLSRCFAEIAEIHRLMSFQERYSDVSRLNREAHLRPVRVDVRTYEVLHHASVVAARSGGVFDVTVAPLLGAANPDHRPVDAPTPDPGARWSDIVLLPDYCVRFSRPLWIDLSGIAKGYAVDRAVELLAASAPAQACVNAGGDLRVMGPEPEWVRFNVSFHGDTAMPLARISNGSVASSGSRPAAGGAAGTCAGVHIDGVTQRASPTRFVSVLAPTCAMADALTKIVMARGCASRQVLQDFAAHAILNDGEGWLEVA